MRRGDMCKSNYSPHTGGTMKQMSYSYEDQQGWQHRENAVWRKCIVEHTQHDLTEWFKNTKQNKYAIVWIWSVPQRHVLKAWFPACGATGRRWNLQEVGPNGRKLGPWGCTLEDSIGTLASSLFASRLP